MNNTAKSINSTLGMYLKSISEFERLTMKEEYDLFRKLESLKKELLRDDLEISEQEKESLMFRKKHITNRLYESCAMYVVSIAKRYLNMNMSFLDLIQEGNIGLLTAIEKFDISFNCRLTTYSDWWIKQAIKKALSDKSRTIKIPLHVQNRLFFIKKRQELLESYLGRDPSIEELSEFVEMKPKNVEYFLNISSDITSLDVGINEDSDTNLIDIIEDNSLNLEEKIIDEIYSEKINKTVSNNILDQREYYVVQMRFGLDGLEQHTLEEAGKKIGVTRERVRQIQTKALKKLKTSKKLQKIYY